MRWGERRRRSSWAWYFRRFFFFFSIFFIIITFSFSSGARFLSILKTYFSSRFLSPTVVSPAGAQLSLPPLTKCARCAEATPSPAGAVCNAKMAMSRWVRVFFLGIISCCRIVWDVQATMTSLHTVHFGSPERTPHSHVKRAISTHGWLIILVECHGNYCY